MEKPLQIGVTGGIGSGKSIVCKLFSCLGIPVYSADTRAKWLTNHHPDLRQKIVSLLGDEAYNQDGKYDTAFVSSRVFQDAELLKQLNAIIHPVVMDDTTAWVNAHAHNAYVIKEAAIMNKAGDGNALNSVIVVEAPENLRISRILQRDKRSEDEIRAIIQRQISVSERQAIADFTIKNDDHTALIPQVMQLHKQFLERGLKIHIQA